ncbi:MAG: GntR family transcriptional regulator [Bacteroidales bacterium]|nr:GntR family transcriptional regulator [Bacteroidales bacterium]MBQ5944157.1 GntR family transcriptional regulator [Bacteroidales bacterium]
MTAMDFSQQKPIYLQILDMISDRVLSGEYKAGERIPSVRDFGADLGVNPNTVMRTFEKLTADGIIFNKRGIGYFISDDASSIILGNERKAFLEEEIPRIASRARLLGISPGEIYEKLKEG